MTQTLKSTSVSLLHALQATGDEVAWRRFFHRYSPMLLAFAKRFGLSDNDAHDVLQDTMVAVHAAFQDNGRPYDRGQGRFKSWLRGIAKHKVRDAQRRRQRQSDLVQRASEAMPSVDTDGDDVFETEWRRHVLMQALEQLASELDPAMYQAFELYAVHGRKPAQVAKLLGVTRNVVYISKTRALRRLRSMLDAMQNEEAEP